MNLTPAAPQDDRWADLADEILNIAREIHMHGYTDSRAIALSGSESNVMRFIDRNPGSAAGDVAQGTGLQRSNLSPALRSLEAKGLIERRHGEGDQRTVLLFPTDLAAQNLRLIRAEWSRIFRRAAGDAAAGAADDGTVASAFELLLLLEKGLVANRRS